jgi:hypothetical protein
MTVFGALLRKKAGQQFDGRRGVGTFDSPNLDMPCPYCHNVRAYPSHLEYIAGAFVARIERGRTVSVIDIPYVQKSIVGSSKASKMLGVWTEGHAFYTESVIGETG